MHVVVNGVRLFFDVEGTKFVPDGPVMREKPTLLMLHGGPGSRTRDGIDPGFHRTARLNKLHPKTEPAPKGRRH
ncbi:hypothetical protein [Bradyrhizobium sp.]|uniref:hypothetical protein n=1 Tax=Bradyrhizobium sp. TaxID=376 RepID=UPI0025C05ED7|nr:hypothetical protein [Bradyrhizobium sp.]